MKSKVIKIDRLFVVKSILICLFLLYTLMVIDFTLINDNFGRSISNIFLADKATVKEYFSQKINFVPFATVKLFINAYKGDNLETLVVLENIFGNFFVFMPLAFFVPKIFKKINSWFKFFLAISISVLIIEALQLVFLTGSADIDDFILNVGGAMLIYGVLSISKVKCAVNKFFLVNGMKVKACAKINLTLDVVGKRADGYHLIDSVFQSISLCDEVVIQKSNTIIVRCNDETICDESNIAYKAAEKFFEFTKICGGAEIVIEKHIPLASGMGGGSADAAAVIVALDKIYETKLSQEKLCEIGLSVGADVPFCIIGGTARVGGIGEKMQKLPNMPDCAMLLIKHGQKLSTADMYKKVDAYPQNKYYTQSMVDSIKNNNLGAVCQNVFNAFDSVCDNEKLTQDIKNTKPLSVSLSGSGPTVFAIYNDIDEAKTASKVLEDIGYNPIIAIPNTKGIIFE